MIHINDLKTGHTLFKFIDDVEESARLRLEVQGAGVVTAGDIVCPPIVEVVNERGYNYGS